MTTGYYALANYRWNKYNDFGVLYDWTEIPGLHGHHESALSAIFTRQFTEQTYARLQLTRGDRPGMRNYTEAWLQMVWDWPAHPPVRVAPVCQVSGRIRRSASERARHQICNAARDGSPPDQAGEPASDLFDTAHVKGREDAYSDSICDHSPHRRQPPGAASEQTPRSRSSPPSGVGHRPRSGQQQGARLQHRAAKPGLP